jgi:hypothetical protein
MNILHVGLCVDGKNEGLPFALKEASEVYREFSTGESDLHNRIIAEANRIKFDLAFFQIQAAGIVHPKTFHDLNEKGIFTVNWSGDIRNGTPEWFFNTNAKLTLFSNERDVRNMRGRGMNADFLQIGIDPKVFKKEDGQGHDIVYMGNNYRNQFPEGQARFNMITMLWAKYKNRFGLYGNGWNLANPENNANQRAQSKIYNGSKIAINFSQFNEERYTSDRMFRILASNCLCLSHHYKGIEKDFVVGEHLDTFKNLAELQNKIDHYLQADDERKKIRLAGYNHCHSNFTYKNMVENLLTLYKKYK